MNTYPKNWTEQCNYTLEPLENLKKMYPLSSYQNKNINTRKMRETCSKLTVKIPEPR